jgi:Arc/MetJ-type ribon-helix-helix transcriptional regulator
MAGLFPLTNEQRKPRVRLAGVLRNYDFSNTMPPMDLTTVRLPENLARSVDEIAKQRQVSRSEIVREALEQYCERANKEEPRSRVELVRSLVAYEGSGVGDLASRSEEHLRKRFDARRRRPR